MSEPAPEARAGPTGRTLLFPLDAALDAVTPPEGAVLPFRPQGWRPGALLPPTARVTGGFLVVEDVRGRRLSAFVVSTDGSTARLSWREPEPMGARTSFRRPRTIDVSVRGEDGAPVTGLFVWACDGATTFHLGGGPPRGWPVAEPRALDSEGRARITGIPPERLRIALALGPDEELARVVGRADATAGDATIEVVLAEEVELTARVTVDGLPGLPDSYTFDVGALTGPTVADETGGTLRVRCRRLSGSPPEVHVTLSSPNHAPASAWATPAAPVQLALVSAGTLVVRTRTPPPGAPGSSRSPPHLRLQEATDQGWLPRVLHAPEREPGLSRFGPLSPGRYRVVDTTTGATSDVAVLVARETAEVSLDLSASGVVTGRVEGPDGRPAAGASVRVEGVEALPAALDVLGGGVPLRPDGTFSVPVPGDRRVTLTAWHPTLSPLEPGGSITLVEPREGVVLRLGPGPVTRVRLSGVTTAHQVRVLAFAGAPEGAPAHRAVPEVDDDGVVSFGTIPPGRWTLWLDVARHAPVVFHDVDIPASGRDLGTVAPSRGSTLRVRLLVREGEAPPDWSAWARRLGEPAYTRSVRTSGEEELDVPGLGPGRFEVVSSHTLGSSLGFLKEVVEVDGVGDLERTIDLR
jgi:hypothetical protein